MTSAKSMLVRVFGAGMLAVWLWPAVAHANVGIPLFTNSVVYAWLLLIPVIGVEASVIMRQLTIPVGRATGVSAVANIISTVLGTVLFTVLGILLGVAGLMVMPGAASDVAVMLALVPGFYVSVWCETLVASRFLENHSRKQLRKAFFLANAFSYLMLGIFVITRFLKGWYMAGYIVW